MVRCPRTRKSPTGERGNGDGGDGCEADARLAAERELKGTPVWLDVRRELVAYPQYAGKGRPRKDASPASQQWQIVATVTVNQERVAQEAFRNACWIVGTNVLEPMVLSDQQLIATYKGQGGAERGFRFLEHRGLGSAACLACAGTTGRGGSG